MIDRYLKHMVDRFLMWRLPETFHPDCGIHFDADAAVKINPRNRRYEPVGTNLFSATEATDMVRFMVEGLPTDVPEDTLSDARLRELWRECNGEYFSESAHQFAVARERLPEVLRKIISAANRAAVGMPVKR